MTWPGQRMWIPYVGLVARLPREHYDPSDGHKGRPVVVIKVMSAERACTVLTRTTEVAVVRHYDVAHQIDLSVGCDHQGWWQVRRAYRVLFSAFEDEDVEIYQRLDDDTLTRVLRAYEERQ
jgi:hypothetical protein